MPNSGQSCFPILIIGGGPAGLSLGQGLLKHSREQGHGILFRIFERDAAASFRAQGYRIRISEEGGAALKSLLPRHIWHLFEATCAEVVNGGATLDARTGEEPSQPTGQLKGMKGGPPRLWSKSWNADRAVLRKVLLKGLEEHVEFGKRLERYELQDDRSVIAYFADGTSERGGMIVGADGLRSVVRRQMLPDYVVLDTEGRAVFGKTPLTASPSQQIPDEIGKGLILIGNPEDDEVSSPMKLFCDVMKFQRDNDVQFDLPADYVYWVLVFQKARAGMEDSQLSTLSNEQSAELSLSLTQDWHQKCRNIMANQDVTATSTLSFFTSRPEIAGWTASTYVTLLGDAAHPMPPVGGVGANAAIQDAVDLFEILKHGQWTVDDIVMYEQGMRTRVHKSVEQSAASAGRFFGMRPIEELNPAKLWLGHQ